MTSKIIKITTTQNKQVVDITEQIEKELGSGEGVVNLFIKHTTCALTTADLDPGTDLDMLDAFEEIMPNLNYRHPHDPAHVTDHILSSMIGTHLGLPYKNGKFILGTWQRIVLIELSGPRERKLVISV